MMWFLSVIGAVTVIFVLIYVAKAATGVFAPLETTLPLLLRSELKKRGVNIAFVPKDCLHDLCLAEIVRFEGRGVVKRAEAVQDIEDRAEVVAYLIKGGPIEDGLEWVADILKEHGVIH